MEKYDGPAFFRKQHVKKESNFLNPTLSKDSDSKNRFVPAIEQKLENEAFNQANDFKVNNSQNHINNRNDIQEDKQNQEYKKETPVKHPEPEPVRKIISDEYPHKNFNSHNQLRRNKIRLSDMVKEINHENKDNHVPQIKSYNVNYKNERNDDFPPIDLLREPNFDSGTQQEWAKNKAQELSESLLDFGVDASVKKWTIGPTVTQFEVGLNRGVKVNKITNLNDDLKLRLAAKDIRIEAPIPGKNAVGIEIPNEQPRSVNLREVLQSDTFRNSESPLTIALGVDLFGKPRVYDLRKMPHGLIAGATGSGKSVFINSLLVSLLYKAHPDELKLLLIDPKAVELAPYNELPYLLSPVISDAKQATAALKWVAEEMDNRYQKLAAAHVRNIEQFNDLCKENHEEKQKMPYIVIVIDELADLMMVSANEVQDYIVRITQKARAAGIHLIIATQRPSVDVVTGLIKNNIPTRIAFMVSSQIDSRTILDVSGAERLIGRGDMLFLGNGQSVPIRIQGTYIDQDVEKVTDYIRARSEPHYLFNPEEYTKKIESVGTHDELMDDVLDYIANEKSISTSKIQRVFSIGYNRAATIVDDLQASGYISEAHGSKPREVYYKGLRDE